MAQVRGLGPRVGGRLALFCKLIHCVNRVYGALTGEMLRHFINCRIIIIMNSLLH